MTQPHTRRPVLRVALVVVLVATGGLLATGNGAAAGADVRRGPQVRNGVLHDASVADGAAGPHHRRTPIRRTSPSAS